MQILVTATRWAGRAALLGLLCGVLYSFGGFVVDLFTIGLNWGTVLAFGALVGMPAIFAVGGFFVGAVVQVVSQALRRRSD